jgi:hypothetical protein
VPDPEPGVIVVQISQVIQALDTGGFRQGDTLVVQGAGGAWAANQPKP